LVKTTDFEKRNEKIIKLMAKDKTLKSLSKKWFLTSFQHEYSYHFKWLGLPIIQYPQDIIALQEIIWRIKPDLIIETGIAHGGSLIFYASILEMLGGGKVLGIDIDIRKNNKDAIQKHRLFKRIKMIQGSSIAKDTAKQVYEFAKDKKRIMIILDSNHSHKHVLKELNLYSPLVTKGSYLVVLDTIIEDMPEELFEKKQWGKGNNPKSAVKKFLETNDRFVIDKSVENKLFISVAPSGYLKCLRDE